jgi:hypothetical protein
MGLTIHAYSMTASGTERQLATPRIFRQLYGRDSISLMVVV